jgi:hypothetical protein
VTTDDCVIIDAHALMRKGLLRWGEATPPLLLSGIAPDNKRYSIRFSADARKENPHVRISFISASGKPVHQVIPLVVTRPHFGGVCPWFFMNGVKARKLYLPPHQDAFMARQAWIGLVYKSKYLRPAKRYRLRLDKFERKWPVIEAARPSGMNRVRWERMKEHVGWLRTRWQREAAKSKRRVAARAR